MKMKERQVMPTTATDAMIEPALILLETMPANSPMRARRLIAEIWKTMCEAAPRQKSTGLTRRQQQVHELIDEYIQEHGISPTYQEIGDMMGKGKSDVFEYVYGLKRRGVIRIDDKTSKRQIRLLYRPGEQPVLKRTETFLPDRKQRPRLRLKSKLKINPPPVSSDHQQPETEENGTEKGNA